MTWYIDGSIDMGNLDVFATDKALGDYRVCMIDCDDETVSEPDLVANARLIAAAPDLLAALKWLACEADEDTPSEYRTNSFRAALDNAFEAIDKAKGAAA
jgi:hypothetical protein